MEGVTPIEWDVLDATADDVENLEQVYLAVRQGPNSTPLTWVALTISSLLDRGLLTCVMDEEGRPASRSNDPSLIWRGWFEMTPRGRLVWQSSRPADPRPSDEGSTKDLPAAWSVNPTVGRIYAGMFAGRSPGVPFEVFKENRREMSRKYSADAADE